MVNTLHAHFGLGGVICELPPPADLPRRLAARLTQADLAGLGEALRSRWHDLRARPWHRKVYQRYFGQQWQALHPGIPLQHTYDLHAPRILEQLEQAAPDLLVVHGTSILKPVVTSTAKLALNIHWGLSPWYRGVRCTEWALLNWDPGHIGVTVHELSSRIDGGRIAAQAFARIEEGDTAHSINMQLSYRGTQLLRQIIQRMQQGEVIDLFAQDLSKGQLIRIRHWSRHISRQIRHIEREGLIAEMLKKPSRMPPASIITL